DKIKLGFNPSGLLWSGGYTRNNQFGLTVDYQAYCKKIIEYLLKQGQYEIHLISHVFSLNLNNPDNDLIACKDLKKLYPELIEAPLFDLPMDVKSYISTMDIFIGARMHATIAAFSTGVATIPFSYSRKFEGLYHSLDYPFLLNAYEEDQECLFNKTMQWIVDYKNLQKAAISAEPRIRDLSSVFEEHCEKLILELSKKI
ncbi:MAG: polysaccharide pyruvyl transferase family protein, partial [Candidatus Cloacimonetes bacterium]|nr:polysaccharide pyruvyl transferase family protein [Candidatus Cloacimonadota bacterium]